MSLFVFLSVLAAALLHATWNALVKVGNSRIAAMMVLSAVQGLIGVGVVATQPVPEAKVWPWLVASGLIHSVYKLFLTFAYEHGDLSRVYPLARGTAPMITLVAGGLWLGEVVTAIEALGILVLGLGILLLARGVWTSGESRRMLPFAFGSACATAGYTLVDGLGARLAVSATQYVGWLF
ncbi:MAG: EamA family transporter, partial [Albidovulum sp.]